MSPTWQSEDLPEDPPITGFGWGRVVLKGAVLGAVTFSCLGLLLLVRLIERPFFGLRRPVTPYITQFVCRAAFVILGIRYRSRGRPMSEPGMIVANHASWLDIFTLNARKRIYYVAKDDVASWSGIGWLARATGTVFIRRDRRDAEKQRRLFADRLRAGHKLLFFPEGTSSDGLRVLSFKPTLFAALFDPELRSRLSLQPVSVIYTAPQGQDPRFYGWWGDMDFGTHLLKVLAAPRQGSVEVIYHPPIRLAEIPDRKALARVAETTVRAGVVARLDMSPAQEISGQSLGARR